MQPHAQPRTDRASDDYISMKVARALEENMFLPNDTIRHGVANGWVTLTGEVEWDYQRTAADAAVGDLPGVTGVTNTLVAKPMFTPADVENKIKQALQRQADRDAQHIEVQVNGGQVTLRGKVVSWAERKAAQGAAWSTPGVASVVNNLLVEA